MVDQLLGDSLSRTALRKPTGQTQDCADAEPRQIFTYGSRNPACNREEVIDEIYSSKPDLMDIPLQNPELELFTYRSSFIHDGQRKAGSAITTTDKIVKAESLPQGWSAQQPELWALAQALRHAEGK